MNKNRNHKKSIRKRKPKSKAQKQYAYLPILLISLILTLIIVYYSKDKISFTLATIFSKTNSYLKNSEEETRRINSIILEHYDKTFGIDLSHYQRFEKIKWNQLYINHHATTIDFVLLRATMGVDGKDLKYHEFWKAAKKAHLIRAAYHYYRPNEDPSLQAQWFLSNIQLSAGDLPPVLDIESFPKEKSIAEFQEDIATWLHLVEDAYGTKPIIYTYYYFYKNYLENRFSNYPLWIANYTHVLTPIDKQPWLFWQFSEKGIVSGISSKVDLNLFNGERWQLLKLTLDASQVKTTP